MISSSTPPAVLDSAQLLRKQSWNANSPLKLFVSRSAIGPRQPLGIVDLSVSVVANAEDTPSMVSADPSVSAKPKKTRRGAARRQKQDKNVDGGLDEQAKIPSSSSRPREEDIQSGMSQLGMSCSDDEDVSAEESSSTQGLLMPPKEHLSVNKFRNKHKERNPHLQYPTNKDSKVLQSGKR